MQHFWTIPGILVVLAYIGFRLRVLLSNLVYNIRALIRSRK